MRQNHEVESFKTILQYHRLMKQKAAKTVKRENAVSALVEFFETTYAESLHKRKEIVQAVRTALRENARREEGETK